MIVELKQDAERIATGSGEPPDPVSHLLCVNGNRRRHRRGGAFYRGGSGEISDIDVQQVFRDAELGDGPIPKIDFGDLALGELDAVCRFVIFK